MDWEQYYKKLGECHSAAGVFMNLFFLMKMGKYVAFKRDLKCFLLKENWIKHLLPGQQNQPQNSGPEYNKVWGKFSFINLIKPLKNPKASHCNFWFAFFCVFFKGQTAGPATQQTSNPDYNAWVDFYRQPMAFFNQGSQQTQAPGLQVRRFSQH